MRCRHLLLLALAALLWAGQAARADARDRFYYLGYEVKNAVVTVPADSVRPVGDNEIAHVRRVA